MHPEVIAKALRGRKCGAGWSARCPAHEDRNPSLSIGIGARGKILLYCHAGCPSDKVIAALSARRLWPDHGHLGGGCGTGEWPRPPNSKSNSSATALGLWERTRPAEGTCVEIYLAARGLDCPIPPDLRFGRLRHPNGDRWPAMVGLVRAVDGTPVAVHRTFLTGEGAKAPVDPQKMSLGPCRGGAVRLAPCAAELIVGEGIETCLSAMVATGKPAWAALSASGLRALELPPDVRDVIVLADGDAAGEAAAQACARRWIGEDRRVRIARAPAGQDFNDVLRSQEPRNKKDAKDAND